MRQQLTFFSAVIKLHYWAATASFFQHGSAYYSTDCMERENAVTHNRQGKSFKYLSALLLEEFLFSLFQTLHLTKLFFCKSSNSMGNYNSVVLNTGASAKSSLQQPGQRCSVSTRCLVRGVGACPDSSSSRFSAVFQLRVSASFPLEWTWPPHSTYRRNE